MMLNGESYSSIVRVAVFRWLDDTTPTVSDIFRGTTSAWYLPLSIYNHDQRGKFNILYDKTHVVSNNGNELVSINKTLKLAKKQFRYTNGTTTGTNKLYVFVGADRALSTSADAYLLTNITYTDS